MEQIEIEKTVITVTKSVDYIATVQSIQDDEHKIYSLLYEGYISEWKIK